MDPGLKIHTAYTSLLTRANQTLDTVLNQIQIQQVDKGCTRIQFLFRYRYSWQIIRVYQDTVLNQIQIQQVDKVCTRKQFLIRYRYSRQIKGVPGYSSYSDTDIAGRYRIYQDTVLNQIQIQQVDTGLYHLVSLILRRFIFTFLRKLLYTPGVQGLEIK